MAPRSTQDLSITSLRGGANNTDAPTAIMDDQCVLAENVEFFQSILGERRNGCGPLDITDSTLTNEATICHLSQWFPTNDTITPEFIAVGVTTNVSTTIAKRTLGAWSPISPNDAINNTAPDVYDIVSQSLNAKNFMAYRSAQDRLHIWDGTTWRRTGLIQPGPPTAVNTGSGAFNGTRYYRVRYVQVVGTAVVRRSEPSTVLTFVPSNTGAGVLITKPAAINEGETHWELEASMDNANFYRIASTAISTPTYTDLTTGPKIFPAPTIPAPVSNDGTNITYVILSTQAAKLNLTGTISNGSYGNPSGTIAGRGWIGYNSSGVYLSNYNVGYSIINNNWWASPDVAEALEQATSSGAQDYAAIGTLSEAIGAYLNIPSAKFLAVDGDRLIYAGHWTDVTKKSQVGWTPVHNDPGVGNDERAPIVDTGGTAISTTVNLDNYDNGPITGIVASVVGTWYIFKWSAIYKMVRTGDVARAYDVLTLSKARGAIPGSIIRGADENGASVIYFLDPLIGPCRLGPGGLQQIVGQRNTWGRVNLQAASVIARSIYYPFKQQVHWWISVDGADRPNLKMVLQTSETRTINDSAIGRGWSTATGRITEATATAIFTEIVTVNGITQLSDRPFIGLTSPDYIQRCDTESTDAGAAYIATIRTKPYLVTGLLNRWGAMNAAILGTANTTASVKVKLLRDFAIEESSVTTNFIPIGSEQYVIKRLDNLAMSNGTTIQVEITDA